jgi:hypothetical protein
VHSFPYAAGAKLDTHEKVERPFAVHAALLLTHHTDAWKLTSGFGPLEKLHMISKSQSLCRMLSCALHIEDPFDAAAQIADIASM